MVAKPSVRGAIVEYEMAENIISSLRCEETKETYQ